MYQTKLFILPSRNVLSSIELLKVSETLALALAGLLVPGARLASHRMAHSTLHLDTPALFSLQCLLDFEKTCCCGLPVDWAMSLSLCSKASVAKVRNPHCILSGSPASGVRSNLSRRPVDDRWICCFTLEGSNVLLAYPTVVDLEGCRTLKA